MLTCMIEMQLECLRYVRQKAFLSSQLGIAGWKESVEKMPTPWTFPELHLCKTSTSLFFWDCHQVTRPTDLHDYVETRGSSLRTLRCPVLQLHFCRRSLADLFPAVPPRKPSESSLENCKLCSCIKAWLTFLVLSLLPWLGWSPYADCQKWLPKPPLTERAIVACVMGKGLYAHLSLVNLLPVMGDTPSSDSGFPGSLTCVDSLGGAVWEVLGLCACLLPEECSVW